VGHKAGAGGSGAKGQVSLARKLTDAEVLQTLESGGQGQARQIAREYAPEAVRKLRALMRSKNSPPGVQRMAAKDLIEFGAGKATPPVNLHLGAGSEGSKIQINVLRFSDNTVEELEVAAARPEKAEGEVVDEAPQGE
jgi:hypothetical protein